MNYRAIFLSIFFLTSCSDTPPSFPKEEGEYLFRQHSEFDYTVAPPSPDPLPSYPWDKTLVGGFPKIVKEHFRCKGNTLNPIKQKGPKGGIIVYQDCDGSESHSLPLRDGNEYIYPVLTDLLNFIQARTEKKVIVTSGHRCRTHQNYLDPSPLFQSSKHLIGGEVNFYVQGLEERPHDVIKIIRDYYQDREKNYSQLERYAKSDLKNMPWYNKEIFIKIFESDEGRNEDNSHPFPYLAIQVKWDREKQERAIYTWKQSQNYLRY